MAVVLHKYKLDGMNNLNQLFQTSIDQFRVIAFLEGLSLLFLLFVAMPLKYIWNKPEFVEHIGLAHGVLFLAYIGFAVFLHFDRNWDFINRTLVVLIASFLPFGTFYIDHKILRRL